MDDIEDSSLKRACPKCDFQLGADQEECPACGIIISKYLARHPGSSGEMEPPPPPAADASGSPAGSVKVTGQPGLWAAAGNSFLARLFYPSEKSCNPLFTAGYGLLLLILLLFSFSLWSSSVESNKAGESFLHLVNLPFHEAGHIFFRPFGQFITTLGGTLGQFLIPLICLVTFLFYRADNFAAAVCFWWTGENFLDIAPYINDARSGTLPLIGGNTGNSAPYGFHDWEYLLTETGLLGYDHHIARASVFTGTIIMAVALLWAGILVWRQVQLQYKRD